MKRVARDETGATAAEYALMASLIAAVIVAIVATMGEEVGAAFQNMVDVWP